MSTCKRSRLGGRARLSGFGGEKPGPRRLLIIALCLFYERMPSQLWKNKLSNMLPVAIAEAYFNQYEVATGGGLVVKLEPKALIQRGRARLEFEQAKILLS